MSKPTDHAPAQPEPHDDNRTSSLTRRMVLARAAVSTAMATIGVKTTATAQTVMSDMEAFITVSAALTGVPAGKLAPTTDSLALKQDYFAWVKQREAGPFAALLQIGKANATAPQAIIDRSQANPDTRYLARSIVLMWYLGSWYKPSDLKELVDKRNGLPQFKSHTVISSKAYTQGWLWRVAQAHPMGYSDIQFGYWARQPMPLADFLTRTAAKGT
jgi:hypothetical protein